jgi:hypothetical protein
VRTSVAWLAASTPAAQQLPAGQPSRADHLLDGGRHPSADRVPLRHVPDAPAFAEAMGGDAEEVDLAGDDLREPEHPTDEGGLAGAVRADEGDHLAAPHDEIGAAQDGLLAVADAGRAELDDGGVGECRRSSVALLLADHFSRPIMSLGRS